MRGVEQLCVFELAIALKELYDLVDDLNGLMDNKHARLLVIRLCAGCHTGVGRYGSTGKYSPEETLII